MVDHGKNAKPRFKTFGDRVRAQAYAREGYAKGERHGTEALSIPHQVSVEATKCLEMLRSYGVSSLTAPTQFYIDKFLRYRQSPPIREACVQMLKELETNKRSPNTIRTVRTELNKLCDRFDGMRLCEVPDEKVIALVNEEENPMTRLKTRRKIGQLFLWAMRRPRCWCDYNPLEGMTLPLVPETTPTIYQVEQVECMLRTAVNFRDKGKTDLVPFIVLQLFAGIRREEVLRLDWAPFDWRKRIIRLDGRITKTIACRNVELAFPEWKLAKDTLWAWLEPYRDRKGKIVKVVNIDHPRQEIEKHCKVEHADNGLRHTCASALYSMIGDAQKTADAIGHRESLHIFHKHYKVLMDRDEAERFFMIRP